jgi:hypothetical protein
MTILNIYPGDAFAVRRVKPGSFVLPEIIALPALEPYPGRQDWSSGDLGNHGVGHHSSVTHTWYKENLKNFCSFQLF